MAGEQTEFEQVIEDRRIEGWSVDRREDDRVVLVKRSYGSLLAHIVIFVFTFYTLGVVNLLYLAYKYFFDVERKVIRRSEVVSTEADEQTGDSAPLTTEPTGTAEEPTVGTETRERASLLQKLIQWWLWPVTNFREYGIARLLAAALAAGGGALFAWIVTATGYTTAFFAVVPMLGSGIGMVVGARGELNRMTGVHAAGIGLLGLFIGYALIQQWLPPDQEYIFGASDAIGAVVGLGIAYSLGSGGTFDQQQRTDSEQGV